MTIVPADMIFRCDVRETNQKVLAANGTDIPILGRTILQSRLGDQDVEIDGLVSEHISDPMLGIDWLQKNGVIWNFAECEIAFNQQKFPLLPSRKGGSYRCRIRIRIRM